MFLHSEGSLGPGKRRKTTNNGAGVDAILILCIACLAKDRKERERYRHIDEKSGYRQI